MDGSELRLWRLLGAGCVGFTLGALTVKIATIVMGTGARGQAALEVATFAVCASTLVVSVHTLLFSQASASARAERAAVRGAPPPDDRRFAGETLLDDATGRVDRAPDRAERGEQQAGGSQMLQGDPRRQAGKRPAQAPTAARAAKNRYDDGGGTGAEAGLASGRGESGRWRAGGEETSRYALASVSSAYGSQGVAGPQGADQGDRGDVNSRSSPDRERLADVWRDYFENGDGRFDASGLRRKLDAAGIAGRVLSDSRTGDRILGVEMDDGKVYLLPHFDSTPSALTPWFLSAGPATRLERIQRLLQVAEARLGADGGFELVRQGKVE